MKKKLSFILAALMLCGLMTACSPAAPAAEDESEGTRVFVDDLGRSVTVPENIDAVAVSGPLTQIYALPVCLDVLVGYSVAFSVDSEIFIPPEYLDLPELGQLYGGKGTMDLEALLAAAPDVIIDVGEPKDNMGQDLDALTEQTGIPFVHIDATVSSAPQAFRRLGELLGKETKAEELALWCEETYAMIGGMMEKVEADGAKKTIMYSLGDKALNAIAEKSFHAETVNIMGDNVVKLEDVVSTGLGNEVDLEQVYLWNPEYIVFEFENGYEHVKADPAWAELEAVKEGRIYKTPNGPYGWLASPPSVQRYLGLLWLGELLYPDYVEYDLRTEVDEYYKLFYNFTMTDEVYARLMSNALPEN